MMFTSLEAYSAAHKALAEQSAAAGKRSDEAEANLHGAIAKQADLETIDNLAKKSTAADLARDELRGAVAQIEKLNPALEQQRSASQEEKKAFTVADALAFPTKGENVALTKDAYSVLDKTWKIAESIAEGTLHPPVVDPNIKIKIPEGDLIANAKVSAQLYADDAKHLVQDANRALAEAITSGKELPGKVADAVVAALPEDVRLAAGGTPESDLMNRGKPAATHNFVQGVAAETDPLKAGRAELATLLLDVGTQIANGADPAEARLNASQNFYKEMTGKPYDKPDGLYDAVQTEIAKRYGEDAAKLYQESIGPQTAVEQQQAMGLHGVSR